MDASESDKCQKERERRRKKYKFALVQWMWSDIPSVEYKQILRMQMNQGSFTILCDDQPERVLKAMLRMLMEK